MSTPLPVSAADPIGSSATAHAPSGEEQGGRLQLATGIRNMQQLIQLRWIAVVGQVITILVVHYGFGIRLPLHQMLVVLSCLAAFNAASQLRWRGTHHVVTNGELLVALLVDVGMLTALLHLSGGATNPFVFLFLLQVALGAVLLRSWASWTLVLVTSACFTGLALFSRPLALPFDQQRGLASPFILGLLVCFTLIAALLVLFINRIQRNLRRRDERLADLRQRAAEEEHVVRMGLLASGAAHELGTPLATLSVIVGDWRHMPTFSSDPVLLQELDEMQAQLARCKSIVSGILLSAGEARGENSERTSVVAFLDELVHSWRASRAAPFLRYANRFGHDLPIASDSALKQMVHNVLDNALEASPAAVALDVSREHGQLVLRCTDEGPGFAPRILAQFGKPYQSTKGRPGGGLGLFLVVNVARTLGGRVDARNLPGGGAEVCIRLPLASLVLLEDEDIDDEDDDDEAADAAPLDGASGHRA